MGMRCLYKMIVKRIKRKEKRKNKAKKELEAYSSLHKSSFQPRQKKVNSFSDPKATSTPITFKIYPLHKSKNHSLLHKELNIHENINYGVFSSNLQSLGFNSGNLSGTNEKFDSCEEKKKENVYENVVFTKSLEIDEKDLSNTYEIVTVNNCEVGPRGRFRPRIVKSGISKPRL